jgi:hypothetical protein
MGKFGIGVRVRDDEGYKGTIVDKRNGERKVKYDCGEGEGAWIAKEDLEVIGLTLREGGYYRTRSGDVVGPMINMGFPDNHPWGTEADVLRWAGSGKYNIYYPNSDDDGDIVAEVPTPVAVATTESQDGFKVGDRVKAVHSDYPILFPVGTIGTVVSEFGRGVDVTADGSDIGAMFFYHHELTPAPSAESSPEKGDVAFSVGDRVRLKETSIWYEFAKGVGTVVEPDPASAAGYHGVIYAGDEFKWHFLPTDLEPAPLTLEAGKFYKTRDGRKVGPMEAGVPGQIDAEYTWTVDGCYYAADGSYWADHEESSSDLVEEWVDPDTEEPAPTLTPASDAKTKFNVGDRVRATDANAELVDSHWRGIFESEHGPAADYFVAKVTKNTFGKGVDEIGLSNKPGGETVVHWRSDRFELVAAEPTKPVPETVAEPKFKVGDRVKSSGNLWTKYRVIGVGENKLDVESVESEGRDLGRFFGCDITLFSIDEDAQPKPISIGDKVTVTGTVAGLGDGEAEITFANDDFAYVPIADVQAA